MKWKTELVNSHGEFKSELGKYMWTRSYYTKHIKNPLSGKKIQKEIKISVSVWLTKNRQKMFC